MTQLERLRTAEELIEMRFLIQETFNGMRQVYYQNGPAAFVTVFPHAY